MEWRLPDPMLAKAVETLPTGPLAYEAKWDGFRAIVSRNPAGAVEIRSRQGTLLNPGFPEITAPARDLPSLIWDGEIVIWHDGLLAFERLLRRLNRRPASVEAEVRASPAHFVTGVRVGSQAVGWGADWQGLQVGDPCSSRHARV